MNNITNWEQLLSRVESYEHWTGTNQLYAMPSEPSMSNQA